MSCKFTPFTIIPVRFKATPNEQDYWCCCCQGDIQEMHGKSIQCDICPKKEKIYGHVKCYNLDNLSSNEFKRLQHRCYMCQIAQKMCNKSFTEKRNRTFISLNFKNNISWPAAANLLGCTMDQIIERKTLFDKYINQMNDMFIPHKVLKLKTNNLVGFRQKNGRWRCARVTQHLNNKLHIFVNKNGALPHIRNVVLYLNDKNDLKRLCSYNGNVTKSSSKFIVGDIVQIQINDELKTLTVIELGDKRSNQIRCKGDNDFDSWFHPSFEDIVIKQTINKNINRNKPEKRKKTRQKRKRKRKRIRSRKRTNINNNNNNIKQKDEETSDDDIDIGNNKANYIELDSSSSDDDDNDNQQPSVSVSSAAASTTSMPLSNVTNIRKRGRSENTDNTDQEPPKKKRKTNKKSKNINLLLWKSWNTEDVIEWFDYIGYGQYVDKITPFFNETEISGKSLEKIGINDDRTFLRNAGITKYDDYSEIMMEIKKLITNS